MVIEETYKYIKKYISRNNVGDVIFRITIIHHMENFYYNKKHSAIRSATDKILKKLCDKKIIKHTEQRGVYSILKNNIDDECRK